MFLSLLNNQSKRSVWEICEMGNTIDTRGAPNKYLPWLISTIRYGLYWGVTDHWYFFCEEFVIWRQEAFRWVQIVENLFL